jgi:serine/threonine-protein phosphatase 2A regulatory subunit A
VQSVLLPYIKKFAEDKSWRIRYLVADRIMELANGIGLDVAKDVLTPFYCAFLKDGESEVRTAAVGKLSEFCKILDQNVILTKIIPSLKDL